MLEEGKHKVNLAGVFVKESKAGMPAVVFELETESGDFVDYESWMHTTKYQTKDGETDGVHATIKLLKSLGCRTTSFDDLADSSKSLDELFDMSKDLTAVIEHEEYTNDQGEVKTVAKAKFLNVRYEKPKLDKKVVKTKYASKYNGLMKQYFGDSLKPKSKPQKSQSVEEDDDDIPF
jgi:hypothetical protein